MKKLGWSSGKKLEFYPSNPGLTPSQVKPQKRSRNHPVCLNNDCESRGVFKNVLKNE